MDVPMWMWEISQVSTLDEELRVREEIPHSPGLSP